MFGPLWALLQGLDGYKSSEEAWIKVKFQRVNIEITNICNLQCSFCPEVVRTQSMMTQSTFKKILSEVSRYTRIVTFHLMGDPLVHPELESFLDLAHEHKLQVYFVTNGVLLKNPELLLHPAIRQVSFSLHSYADNFPEKDPTQYLTKIFDFTELAFNKRPTLFINYRLWNLESRKQCSNQNELIYQKIEERFKVTILRDWNYHLSKSQKLLNYLSLHFETEFIWPGLDLPILGTHGTCHGLKNHIGILVDGTVVPCCLDKEGKIALGNLKEHSLKDILNSPRAQSILKGFQNNQLVEDLCKRCQYIERFSGSDSF